MSDNGSDCSLALPPLGVSEGSSLAEALLLANPSHGHQRPTNLQEPWVKGCSFKLFPQRVLIRSFYEGIYACIGKLPFPVTCVVVQLS